MFKRSIINTIIQVVGKGLMVLIALVTTAWLTRRLGAEVYGKLTLISAVFLLLDAGADFGIKIIGVREMVTEETEKGKEKIFSQIVILRWILTGIAYVVGLIMIGTWSSFETVKLAAVLSLTMIWMTSTVGSLEIIFQSRMRMGDKVIMDVLFPLLFLVIFGSWKGGLGLEGVVVIYLVARALSLGYGLVAAKIKNFEWKIDKKLITHLLAETWPMGVYLIVFTSYDRAVDSMMISHYMGVKEVAWYGLAYKIYINLLQPVYFFVNSIFPLLSAKKGSKKKLFNWSLIMILGVVSAMIPIVYWLAPWMVNVLAGPGYEPAVTALRWLIWATLFSYLGHLFGFTLISRNGQKSLLVMGGVILVFNITMNWWLIPKMGIVGASVVTVMTEALGCLLMGIALLRTVKK